MSCGGARRLPQGGQNGAFGTLATLAALDHTFQLVGHALKIGQAGTDVGQVAACQTIYVHTAQPFITCQLQQAADLFQTETQVPAPRDEP